MGDRFRPEWVIGFTGMRTDPPGEIRVEDGRQVIGAGQAAFAWHDVPVERFYVDEAQTVTFTGVIDTGAGAAIASDGAAHAMLYGDAPEGGAPR